MCWKFLTWFFRHFFPPSFVPHPLPCVPFFRYIFHFEMYIFWKFNLDTQEWTKMMQQQFLFVYVCECVVYGACYFFSVSLHVHKKSLKHIYQQYKWRLGHSDDKTLSSASHTTVVYGWNVIFDKTHASTTNLMFAFVCLFIYLFWIVPWNIYEYSLVFLQHDLDFSMSILRLLVGHCARCKLRLASLFSRTQFSLHILFDILFRFRIHACPSSGQKISPT